MNVLIQSLDSLHRILGHDFCPWANRWVYWMKHPLASVAAAALVALSCGLFVNPYAFVLLGVLVVITLLGVFWPWITVRGLTCEAEFLSHRCRVEGAVLLRLRIRNRWPWPAWGLSIRRGFTDESDESKGIALSRVAGGSETEFEWMFRPHRRGVFPIVPPEVDTGFPFGLIHARAPISLRGQLLVWPRTVPLDALPDAVEIQTREQRLAERIVGDCGDILGTRPFREGDSLRRIHWRQTARFGRIIVTERQAPASCAVLLHVDIQASSHVGPHGVETLETTLSVAASILESLHRQHAFVEVKLGNQSFSVGASALDLQRCLDAFARVPDTGEPHAMSTCQLDRPSRRLTTITVTTRQAFERHVQHRHLAGFSKYVLIETLPAGETNSPAIPSSEASEGCHCRAWLTIGRDEPLDPLLKERWRRACHVG